MIRQRAAWLVISLVLLVTLSGCWSNIPVDRRNLVLMMGAAPAPHDQIELYFQVPTSKGLSSLTTSGSGGGAGNSSSSFENITGTGSTVGSAFSAAQAGSQRDLYLGQTQIVVLSTKLTPDEFSQMAGWITRLGSFDKTSYVVATPSIQKLFNENPQSGELPGLVLSEDFACSACATVNLKRTFWDLERTHFDRGISLWLPLVTESGQKFRVASMVAYSQDTPSVYLTSLPQVMVFGYLVRQTDKGYLSVSYHGIPVSIRALRAITHYSTTWSHGKPDITIHISVFGTLNELKVESTPEVLAGVEVAAEKKIGQEAVTIIHKFQTGHTDPVGFGQKYVWYHLTQFSQRGSWRKAFAHASVTVTTKVVINNVGDLI